jgi:hypothetical protein
MPSHRTDISGSDSCQPVEDRVGGQTADLASVGRERLDTKERLGGRRLGAGHGSQLAAGGSGDVGAHR